MYEALDSVQNGLDSIIENVAATFWKVNVGLLGIFLKIPGVFSMILTVAAAGFWSSVLGVVALDGVTDGAATAAGAVDFFAKGFQYIADKRAASAVSQIEVETNLKSASLQFFTQTREVLDEWMKTAFNGDWQDYRNLGTHVENGLFLKDRSVLSFDWYTTMTPVVTGMSIVEAWRQKGPVAIIYENGDKVNPSNSLVSGSAETMRVKVPDGDYTLVRDSSFTTYLVQHFLCTGYNPIFSGLLQLELAVGAGEVTVSVELLCLLDSTLSSMPATNGALPRMTSLSLHSMGTCSVARRILTVSPTTKPKV